ncbi:entericidin A/B family lipoprotein [Rhizobacter sp. LjRoot28]|jgi:predicted small secreted protein
MKKITAILLASVSLMLVGCNTVGGFGKDVQKVGEKVEESADKKK